MSEERKRAFWPWVVAPLIGLPLLYIASFGPACWTVTAGKIADRPIARAYRPIVSSVHKHKTLRSAFEWYAGLFPDHHYLTIERLIDAAGLTPMHSGSHPINF